jgi:hypothetical protein
MPPCRLLLRALRPSRCYSSLTTPTFVSSASPPSTPPLPPTGSLLPRVSDQLCCPDQAHSSEPFDRVPVMQVPIPPVTGRRKFEIRFVFRDELRKLPRIRLLSTILSIIWLYCNVICSPHLKGERGLRSCARSQGGEWVGLQITPPPPPGTKNTRMRKTL